MIKIFREHKGIRQEDLAYRLGITQPHLSRLENNSVYKINVNIDLIENLAMELNICPVAVFLYFLDVKISCPFQTEKT
ncbi:helix-turn-helix domain-containing protein [Clostridium botulinum]|uniref:helix-turn-helix domain-containing protein n=1 Tax=Clostridium botulinum TaxID=1491 RepID=UPI003EF3D5EF